MATTDFKPEVIDRILKLPFAISSQHTELIQAVGSRPVSEAEYRSIEAILGQRHALPRQMVEQIRAIRGTKPAPKKR